MGKHSLFGPSACKRIILCPASLQYHQSQGSTEFALEGTAAHWVHEQRLLNPSVSADCYLDMIVHLEEDGVRHDITVTEEMLDAVEESVDRIHDILDDALLSGNTPVLLVEKRVDISRWTPIEDQGGTADVIIVDGTTLHVADYKHGMGVFVPVHENVQCALYALGALQEYGALYDIREVQIHVHQPRMNNMATWTLTTEELHEFGEQIAKALGVAVSSEAHFGPSEDACQFCSHAPRCPALAEKALKMAQGVFDDLTAFDPDFDAGAQVKETTVCPQTLDDNTLADIWRHRALLTKWVEAVCTEVERRLMSGHKIAGLKLVEGRSRRTWADESAASSFLSKVLDPDKIFKHSIVSPAQAEKMFPRSERERLAPYILKTAGAPTVAPEEDKRPEFVRTSAELFDDLSDDGP